VRIYFNTSALNRPFDDQSSERVRLEADAVAAILAAVGSLRSCPFDFIAMEIDERLCTR
jgi:hypothetical protein